MIHEAMNKHKPLRGINDKKFREPCRTSAEAVVIFKDYYCNVKSLLTAVSKDHFPAPDLVVASSIQCGKKLYWKVSTLQKELRKREATKHANPN